MPLNHHTLARLVLAKAASEAKTIKNRGTLNPAFFYFSSTDGSLVTGSSLQLSDHSTPKYYTVAADMLVFSPSKSHVLMIFRCPHNKKEGRSCSTNVLDTLSFQYKGCLATPGGFFDAKEDIVGGSPDFCHSAVRELNEECSNLFAAQQNNTATYGDIHFITPEFNNYRDIRWFTSQNYVPTLAAQFATILPAANNNTASLPVIKGSDDACGNAYWIDVRIIQQVYSTYKSVYESFDQEFNQATFDAFLKTHFVLDSTTNLPRNKLKSENTLLRNLNPSQYVVDFDSTAKYQFSDFAFDHVRNIVRAFDVLANENSTKESVVVVGSKQ
ncbi:hypothetical protein BDR26DRAFT_849505 [Obelidium mucronatum]|nr:hypothetical protein BDR26DRAFT_849505 [Obelidium mucronatum]